MNFARRQLRSSGKFSLDEFRRRIDSGRAGGRCLSGGICLPNKKQPDGKKRRRDLLAKCGFEDIDAWMSKLSGSGAMPDDLLDACACAIAADSRGQKLECDRECDAQGLRMEMWF